MSLIQLILVIGKLIAARSISNFGQTCNLRISNLSSAALVLGLGSKVVMQEPAKLLSSVRFRPRPPQFPSGLSQTQRTHHLHNISHTKSHLFPHYINFILLDEFILHEHCAKFKILLIHQTALKQKLCYG